MRAVFTLTIALLLGAISPYTSAQAEAPTAHTAETEGGGANPAPQAPLHAASQPPAQPTPSGDEPQVDYQTQLILNELGMVNSRLDRVEGRLDKMDDRLDGVEREIAVLKAVFDNEINGIHRRIDETNTNLGGRIDETNDKIATTHNWLIAILATTIGLFGITITILLTGVGGYFQNRKRWKEG